MAVSFGNLGILAQNEGRYRAAFDSYGEALTILEEVGETSWVKWSFSCVRPVPTSTLGRLRKQRVGVKKVEALQVDDANHEVRAVLLRMRGRWHELRGEHETAWSLLTEAITEAEASRGAKAVIEARIAAGLVSLRGRNWGITRSTGRGGGY